MKEIASDHGQAFAARGIQITSFDKTGWYYSSISSGIGASASYSKHFVYGFFLDIIDPSTIPSQHSAIVSVAAMQMDEFDLEVPAGTAGGAIIQFTAPDGRVVQATVPEDHPQKGTIRVRI